MSAFDRTPLLFRATLVTATAIVIALAAISIYRFGSLPTDENLFTNPPSNLLLVHPFPVTTKSGEPATVGPGGLLVALGTRPIRTLADLQTAAAVQTPNPRDLVILKLEENTKVTFRVQDPRGLAEAVRELPPTAQVIQVIPGGASDHAGMRVGDLITEINGQGFRNVADADRIMRKGQAGRAIEYRIIRGTEQLSLEVILAAFGLPFWLLVMIIAGLVWMGVGVFLGLVRPTIRAAQLLALMFLCGGIAVMVGGLGREVSLDFLAHLRRAMTTGAVVALYPLSIHSGMLFPQERPELLSRPWVVRIAYAIAILSFLIVLLAGDQYILLALALAGVYALFIHLRFRKLRTQAYIEMSRTLKRTSIGMVILMFMLGIIGFFVRIPVYPDYMGIIGFSMLFIPAGYLYVIGHYRLFDLDLRIRRTLQYLGASVILRATLIVLFLWTLVLLARSDMPLPNVRLTGGSIELLDTPASPERYQFLRTLSIGFLAIGVSVLFWFAGKAGLRLLARRYHRTGYDYRRAAAELAEVMATKLSMGDLAQGIVEKLVALMQVKRAGVLFFRDEKKCCCLEAAGFDGEAWKQFCLHTDLNIAGAIAGVRHQVNIDALPAALREEFQHHAFHILVPVRSKDRLIGALLVGEKQSEAAFEEEDFEFLEAAANQASVSIENAFLYEELTEQERLKHELAIARRIQLDSLPQKTPAIPGLDIAGRSLPALEVGGDYFDYLNGSTGSLTVIIGDVSGKGTSAALYMSKVQGIFRSLHGFGLGPRELFVRANDLLCNDLEKRSFVTAIGASFDPQRKMLRVARAGHPPILHYSRLNGTVSPILPRGLGLGLNAEGLFATELEETGIPFDPGDVFLFYTDGVTDARRADGEQFGDHRLEESFRATVDRSASEIRDRLLGDVAAFCGEIRQFDDQTVVVVRIA